MAEVVNAVPMNATVESNSKTMAAIAWFLSWTVIGPLVFILIDSYKKDRYVQFHAWEALAFGIISTIANVVLSWTCIVPVAILVVWIIGMVKSYQGEMWKLPVLGDWSAEQAEKTVSGATK